MSESDEKSKDEVYYDRNLLAIALAAETDAPSGWRNDPDTPGYVVVWVATPMGEVSHHVPRQMVEESGLRRHEQKFPGYDREEKNERLMGWIQSGR